MHYRSQFAISRFGHYAHRMATWLGSERLHRSIQEGVGRVTPMLWNFTSFDGDCPFDADIRHLLQMEEALGSLPQWAIEIAVQIDALPHCGQSNFPEPIFAICRGIGQECPDPGFLFCFEATSPTKAQAQRYARLLGIWCLEEESEGLSKLWQEDASLVRLVFQSLGERTELKGALAKYVALYLQLLTEELTTNDNGVLTLQTNPSSLTRELANQRDVVEGIAHRQGFDTNGFFSEMEHPWLCHSRLFDQFRVTLERIGREESYYDREQSLQDAEPFARQMQDVYDTSIQALSWWLAGDVPDLSKQHAEMADIIANTYGMLGETIPVKRWLVMAFHKKLRLFREGDLTDALAV